MSLHPRPEPRRYSVADDMMRDKRRPQPTLPDPFMEEPPDTSWTKTCKVRDEGKGRHRLSAAEARARGVSAFRGIVIGLALSTLFWALCVLLPLWLHYGPAGVGR